MKHKVYLETSFFSYLTAWRSRDLVIVGNQETTKELWDQKKEDRGQENPYVPT